MESTPNFRCWCKLVMWDEWKELEAEINQVVFGEQESYNYTSVAPSPALTRCTLPSNSPAASTTTASPFERSTSLSPNEESFLPITNSTAEKVKFRPINRTTGTIHPTNNGKFLQSTGANFRRTATRINPSAYQVPKDHRGLQSTIVCIPPRSTAKRQKKTLADLERAEPPRCRRLHVSNIPFWFEEHHLVKIFKDYGNVIQAEVIYNDRGSKGFGFVTFEDDIQATEIRKLFNGLELYGRVIEVNYASKRQGNKNRTQPPGKSAQPENTTVGKNHRNNKSPLYAPGRPNSASAWQPLHHQNPTRLPRVPPMSSWHPHQRRKFGPRL